MTPWQRYHANHYGVLFSFPFLFAIVAFLWPLSGIRTFTLVMSGIGTLMFGYGMSWARARDHRFATLGSIARDRYLAQADDDGVPDNELHPDAAIFTGAELNEIAAMYGTTSMAVVRAFQGRRLPPA